MLQYESAVSGAVTDNVTFGVECDPSKVLGGPLFFCAGQGLLPVNEDPKNYFLGKA